MNPAPPMTTTRSDCDNAALRLRKISISAINRHLARFYHCGAFRRTNAWISSRCERTIECGHAGVNGSGLELVWTCQSCCSQGERLEVLPASGGEGIRVLPPNGHFLDAQIRRLFHDLKTVAADIHKGLCVFTLQVDPECETPGPQRQGALRVS